MKKIYNTNGLPFCDQREIATRNYLASVFTMAVRDALLGTNRAWEFHQIEAPCLTPRNLISSEYDDSQVFAVADDLVLRPETTPASYAYAAHLLDSQLSKPPLVVWQVAKSFRREQDQVTKNVRLKEFYQQEFQCIFSEDSKNDYFEAISPAIERMIRLYVGLDTRLVPSDRLPAYSRKTMDVEVYSGDRLMEVVSLSLRDDVPFDMKRNGNDVKLLNMEIAIGLDRCVYNSLRLFED